MRDADDTRGQERPSPIDVTVIVQNRYTFETEGVTGMQIKETANIPVDFTLQRRVRGGNEPIRDDESVELHHGDHFFARPPSNVASHRAARVQPG
jgi:hypothetical protein